MASASVETRKWCAPSSRACFSLAGVVEIAVTSHPDSELRRYADVVLDMGVIKEPCPLGLTPSASMAVMLAVSDAVALALMEAKGVTRHDYGLRHHGGYLGRAARTDNLPTS